MISPVSREIYWFAHSYLFCRQWRDVGEQPSLWAKLELFFEGREDVELHQVLALRRLQSLQSLYLCCWDRTRHLLQTVLDGCPNLRKLDLAMDFIPIPDDELTGIAETLVKFEEIDLTEGFIIKGKERSREYLRAILAALPGEGSKLKILTLHGCKKKLGTDLTEARERGLTVKVESVFEDDSEDWTDSDNNSGIEFEDEDDFANSD